MAEFNPGSASDLNHAVKLRYEANPDTNVFTDTEKAKLAGIAAGATANADDAALRDRASHTGIQPVASVDGLQAALDGKAPASHTHAAADVADSSAAGRAMLTAADAAAQTALLNAFTPGAKGLAPASGGGTANFLRADGAWAAPPGGASDPLDLADDTPGVPAADRVRLFRRTVSGRAMPAFVGPAGLDTALQPFLARNKIAWFQPVGNGTANSNIGIPAASQGIATARNVGAGSYFSRIRRIGYRTSTTAGTLAGLRATAAQYATGDGAGLGGFHLVIRFGLAEVVSDMRAFVGVDNETAVPTNTDPAALGNFVGMARIDGSANWHIVHGGSVAQTPIDLGANFPADTANADFYELALFAPSTVAETVHWMVTRLNTGHVASGTLTGDTTVLPGSTTLLAVPRIWITNNTTAAGCAIDIASVYIETDQ